MIACAQDACAVANIMAAMPNTSVPQEGTIQEDELYMFSTGELVVWFLLYSTIALLSVSGNCLVIWVILTRPRFQTVTNYFIVNLAVADAMTGLLAIPFKFQAALLQKWLLPEFMCSLVPFVETVALSVSVFTLTGTAIDRFRAVMFPLSRKLKKAFAKLIIFIIWLISVVCSVPYGVDHQVTRPTWIPNATYLVCMPRNAEHDWWKIYNVYLTIVQYFVPLFIINTVYCVLGYKVWLTKPLHQDHQTLTESFEHSKRRVIKMLVIVVAVFTFCWLPYETYLVLSELCMPVIFSYQYINVIFFCCHALAMSNSCLNPIIYGIYNEKFQREYKAVFRRCCGKEGQSLSHDLSLYGADSEVTNTPRPMGQQNGRYDDQNTGAKRDVYHSYIAAELGRDDDEF